MKLLVSLIATAACHSEGLHCGGDGMELVFNEKTGLNECTDINECTDVDHRECLGPAHNQCFNEIGSYKCGCADGFVLQEDNQRCLDKNECDLGNPCTEPNKSVCTNLAGNEGKYSCGCDKGYELGDGDACVDKDECNDGHVCDANADCFNIVGGVECHCKDGYGKSENNGTVTCADLNECASPDLNNCNEPNGSCENTDGGYNCVCNEGYENPSVTNSTCLDTDECKDSPCVENNKNKCENVPGGYECGCNTGFKENEDGECTDVNECAEGGHTCHENANCANIVMKNGVQFNCECKDGYVDVDGYAVGTNCTDVNECETENFPCNGGECRNTAGSYECDCDGYWFMNNGTCSDVDECAGNDYDCSEFGKGRCVNLVGNGYYCGCSEGFLGNMTDNSCYDFDECEENDHDCGSNQDCNNEAPGWSCSCKDGYQFVGDECEDVDECEEGTASCEPNSSCKNTDGGYNCPCDFGFEEKDGVCVNIDECEDVNVCVLAGLNKNKCVDLTPDYRCDCNAGYSEDDSGACNNVNECLSQGDNCDDNAKCTDDEGTFNCMCHKGYTDAPGSDPGTNCTDINECDDENFCGENGACENSIGGYTCSCAKFYKSEVDDQGNESCVDKNECAGDGVYECNNPDDPHRGTCFNTDPEYKCVCNNGYKENLDGKCVDKDECEDNECGVSPATCKNNDGSFECGCEAGHMVNETATEHQCIDMDDCDDNPCGPGTCSDTGTGSWECLCDDGFKTNENITCVDKDECDGQNGGTFTCMDANKHTCENNVGSYDCVCDDGYAEDDNGDCQDVDECAGEGDGNDCGQFSKCTNTKGGFSCACLDGYSGNADGKVCGDVNECTSGSVCQGPNAQGCKNKIVDLDNEKYWCTCNVGFFHKDGSADCTARNECAGDGVYSCPKPNKSVCKDTDFSYECTCDSGYTANEDGDCIDDDECLLPEDNDCSANADCKNEAGSYKCTCKAGYEGDGVTCDDIDECDVGTHDCSEFGVCSNTPGKWRCYCMGGFKPSADLSTCVDKDECGGDGVYTCDDPNQSKCRNTFGGYECDCDSGYNKADDGSCSDINECKTNGDNCDDLANCNNIGGSFECVCKDGYEGDGIVLPDGNGTCTDIDECEQNKCGDNAQCENTVGSYECECNLGYMMTDNGCEDVNECNNENNSVYSCNEVEHKTLCVNTKGSYTCDCGVGFLPEDGECINEIECSSPAISGKCDTNAACKDTIGSYYCECNEGYSGSGFECVDDNECEIDENSCPDANSNCVNTDGTFRCDCNEGYQKGDGDVCEDIDECHDKASSFTCDGPDGTRCINTDGGYECGCRVGMKNNGTGCFDIDECETEGDNCGQFSQCSNIQLRNGEEGFTCECLAGYTGDGIVCGDKNECQNDDGSDSNICGDNHTCKNLFGSHTCQCSIGYKEEDGTCVNANECDGEGVYKCGLTDPNKGTCVDTTGSYVCECNYGFEMKDGKCADIDECANEWDDCHAMADCNNIDGSWECECTAGYSGSGQECEDDNECDTEGSCPAANSECVNLPGTFNCKCSDGFYEDGQACGDVDECADDYAGDNGCVANSVCNNFDGGHSCSCDDGWHGNATDECFDDDECDLGTHDCSEYATCTNTPGAWSCECQEFYKGDGHECSLCPSTECWDYDSDSHVCSLKPSLACSALICLANSMQISFSSKLFGIDDNEPITWAGELEPSWNSQGSAWGVSVGLGEGGMTHRIEGDKLIFTAFIGVHGDQRQRSDIAMKNIETFLNHTTITTGFNGVAMKYECSYNRTISVSSETFAVEDVTVTDNFDGMGNLASGFSMVLNNNDGLMYILGAELPVEVKWSVNVLADLKFNFDNCKVTHGITDFFIIKDGCYATTVAARPLAQSHNSNSFEYRVFKAKGEMAKDQTIECVVTVCNEDSCQSPESNSDCPSQNHDSLYGYTIDGLPEGK